VTESPTGALERLAEATGASFPHLFAARDRTEDTLRDRRQKLSELEIDRDASVVLMGSWGRRELTGESDDDYMVILNGRERTDPRPRLDAVRGVVGGGERKPGAEGTFDDHVYSRHLAERIGLDRDDNRNLTRRMLLVLESLPAVGEHAYHEARAAVLDGYLDVSVRDFRPPRFFLNDTVRYWRTICVDFVGKERERGGEGWGLRNAKLRTSRKLLFASGLLPILECHKYTAAGMRPFLEAQLAAPPTDRVADAFIRHGAIDAGGRAFEAYDRFIGLLHDPPSRRSLQDLSREEADESPAFAEARRIGRELEGSLLSLLFETDELRALIREFGIF